MRTDAMLFSLPNGNPMKGNSRMDRVHDLVKPDASQGSGISGNRQDTSKERFGETYSRIARENENANRVSERIALERTSQSSHSSHTKHDQNVQRNNRVGKQDEDDSPRVTDDHDTDKVVQPEVQRSEPVDNSDRDHEDSEKVEQASKVIREALQELSDGLGLKVGNDLEDVQFSSSSDDVKEQFAEILSVLKKMGEMLDEAGQSGEPLEINGASVDLKAISQYEQLVKTSQFKIEVGISMLGMSSDVAEKMASKLEQAFADGIPQAVNPADIKMSSIQLKQIFGNAVADPQSEVAELANRMIALVKEAVLSTETPTVSIKGTTKVDDGVKKSELTSFDNSIMRTLLKIDAKAEISAENSDAAASNEKFGVPFVNGPAIAKDGSDVGASKSFEQLLAGQVAQNNGNAQSAQVSEAKLTGALARTVEQSVYNQLTDKLHSAVRAGVTEVRIQLRPESLGHVQLQIRMEGDVIAARIQVESQQVKAIVESSLQQLKDSLAQQNLHAGSFEVNVGLGDHGAGQAWDQAFKQENGQSNHAQTKEHTDSSKESSDASQTEGTPPGDDTGRRFGSNTVEYFA